MIIYTHEEAKAIATRANELCIEQGIDTISPIDVESLKDSEGCGHATYNRHEGACYEPGCSYDSEIIGYYLSSMTSDTEEARKKRERQNLCLSQAKKELGIAGRNY
jgi:hypothetical protein